MELLSFFINRICHSLAKTVRCHRKEKAGRRFNICYKVSIDMFSIIIFYDRLLIFICVGHIAMI